MMNVINVFPWRFIIAVSAIKKKMCMKNVDVETSVNEF